MFNYFCIFYGEIFFKAKIFFDNQIVALSLKIIARKKFAFRVGTILWKIFWFAFVNLNEFFSYFLFLCNFQKNSLNIFERSKIFYTISLNLHIGGTHACTHTHVQLYPAVDFVRPLTDPINVRTLQKYTLNVICLK